MYLMQITTPWMCAGILCASNGTITDSAPILRTWIGQHFRELTAYYSNRCGSKFTYKLVIKE